MDPLEFDESQRFTVDPRSRVLVVISEPVVEAALVEAMSLGGFAAHPLRDPAELMAAIDRLQPELVVLGESFAQVTGRQLALSLRARGSTFALPAVGVLGDPSVPNVLRWLTVGAVDTWPSAAGSELGPRARRLIEECRVTRIQTQPAPARLLAYARRSGLAGVAVVYADTPFEGRVAFERGELTEAFLGEARGAAALAQLVELDEAPVTWTDASTKTQPMVAEPISGPRRRVLVVEDVGLLGEQLKDTLHAHGFDVEVARDGRAGLQAALAEHFDVVLVDLNLPLLDGWGLMRQLKEDPVARESAVLVLSAQDANVETLKAARAGARAWLKKTGRSKELVDAVELLARPRALAWAALASAQLASIELRSVGPAWLLRSLAELDCRGRLLVDDELSHFEVRVSHGQLASAAAQVGSRRVHGAPAIQALLGSRGTASFEPKELTLPLSAPWLHDVVQSACEAVVTESQRALERAISSAGGLELNQELALLFARVATAREIQVMDAFAAGPRSVEELALEVRQPPEEVRAAIAELLRRGVLSTEPL